MVGMSPAERPRKPSTWGTRAMRNPRAGAERYDPNDENLTTGTGREEGGVNSGASIVHGNLAGLSSDDHTQYLASYRHRGKVSSKSVTYLATVTDFVILMDASGGARVVDLPAASTANEVMLVVKKIDSSGNTVTIDGNSGETIDGATTLVLSAQWSTAIIICNGTSWFVLSTF